MRETYLWVNCRWVHAWLSDAVFSATPRHRPAGDCSTHGGALERLRNGLGTLAVPEGMVAPAAALPLAGAVPSAYRRHVSRPMDLGTDAGSPVAVIWPGYPSILGPTGPVLPGAPTGPGEIGGPIDSHHPIAVREANALGVFVVAIVVLLIVHGRKAPPRG